MELSEIFLLAWAVVATALAVVFRHEAVEAHLVLVKSMFLVRDIAEGKATVTIEAGGNLKIRKVGE